MTVFMIGEAANHKETLAARLTTPCDIVALPREAAYAPDHDAAIGADDVVISLRFARKAAARPRFRLLHVPGAGLDGIDFDSLSPETEVCNVFEHEIPIAEFVAAAMLHWEIRLPELRRSFTSEGWSDVYRARVPHGEVHGKTLGLIGYGRIGRTIAGVARALGLTVLPVDSVAPTDDIRTPDRLTEVLAVADYLVIACPLTDHTRGLIGTAELGAMKRSAVLINVSRAPIVDEEALYHALADRVIGGAVLDVWYGYPTGAADQVAPSRFRFEDLPNAVCTPHSSAWTTSLTERRYAVIARNIDRLHAGEPRLNVVRPPVVQPPVVQPQGVTVP